jgi:hypothetical protein
MCQFVEIIKLCKATKFPENLRFIGGIAFRMRFEFLSKFAILLKVSATRIKHITQN